MNGKGVTEGVLPLSACCIRSKEVVKKYILRMQQASCLGQHVAYAASDVFRKVCSTKVSIYEVI